MSEQFGSNENDQLIGTRGRDLIDGGAGDDVISGDSGSDVLRGDAGDDQIDGGNGRDSIRGGVGSDVLTGGRGRDSFLFAQGEGGDTISDFEVRRDTFELNAASFGVDDDLRFQNVARTANDDVNADLVDVDTGNNVFVLQGIWNNAGQAATALINSGVEGPFFFVYYNVNLDVNRLFQAEAVLDENGNPVLDENGNPEVALQQLANLGEAGQFAEGVNDDEAIAQLADFDADNFTFEFGDRIVGDRDDNVLVGTEGDDTIKGRRGDDTIDAGDGDDFVSGGRGQDVIFGGAGDDELRGGRGADDIDGGEGADVISGGRGADELRGGTGADTLTGGRGADAFAYADGEGGDTILDFRISDDKFTLDAESFGVDDELQFQNVERTDDNDVNAGLVNVDAGNNVFVLQGIWNNAGQAAQALIDEGVEGPFFFVYYNVNLDVNRLFQAEAVLDDEGNPAIDLQQLNNLGETNQFAEGVNDRRAINQLDDFSQSNFEFENLDADLIA